MNDLISFFSNLKFRFKGLCGKYSPLFYLFFYPRNKHLMVNKHTDLVIEGFPRSGNTFCVVAFSEFLDHQIRIAHHTHAPIQVKLAARFKVPSVVILRNPVDSFKSLLIMYPRFNLTNIARSYYEFYSYLLKNDLDPLIVPFELLINDLTRVIGKMWEKTGLGFENVITTKWEEEDIFEKIRNIRGLKDTEYETSVSVPDRSRDHLKKKIEIDPNNKYVKMSIKIYHTLLERSEF